MTEIPGRDQSEIRRGKREDKRVVGAAWAAGPPEEVGWAGLYSEASRKTHSRQGRLPGQRGARNRTNEFLRGSGSMARHVGRVLGPRPSWFPPDPKNCPQSLPKGGTEGRKGRGGNACCALVSRSRDPGLWGGRRHPELQGERWKSGMQGLGGHGEMHQGSHPESRVRTPPQVTGRPWESGRAGRAHVHQTTLPAWPEALRGSWREAQRWTGGNTVSTVAHPATSKHPVLPPPQPPGTGWCWKCCGVKLFPGTVGVLGWNSGAVAEYNSLRMPPGGATCNGRLCSMAPL